MNNTEMLIAALSGGYWKPKRLANLLFWSDASLINQSDGSRIESWLDLSGNGNHRIKATDPTRPYFETAELNGLGVIRLSQADQTRLAFTSPFTQNTFTYFIVMSNTGTSATNTEYILGNSAAGNINQNQASYELQVRAGSTLSVSETQTFGFKIFCFIGNGASSAIRVNGSEEASGNIGSDSFTWNIWGNNVSTFTLGWDGMVAEDFLVGSVLSASDIHRAEQYLANKWGITLS
jgi:hypothetical protein